MMHLSDEDRSNILDKIRSRGESEQIAGGQKTQPLLSVVKEQGDSVLTCFTRSQSSDLLSSTVADVDQLHPNIIKSFLVSVVFRALNRSLYPHVNILPIERTALITFPFADIPKAEEVIQNETQRVTHRWPYPIGEFLRMMMFIFEISSSSRLSQRIKRAKKNGYIQRYIEIASKLENSLFEGTVDFSTPTLQPGRILLFQPKDAPALEISIASSMVKELSPLVLYLRHVADNSDLLVIDEPEMNLHPIAQVRFVEFIAMLVNAGLHVLVTTHSPYMVDHLANLMAATEVDHGEDLLFLKDKDALLDKEKVSVYLFGKEEFRDNKEVGSIIQVKSIIDEEGDIDWGTFGKVSDRITEIYGDLLAKSGV